MRPVTNFCIAQRICRPCLTVTRSPGHILTVRRISYRKSSTLLLLQSVHASPSNNQQSTEDEEFEGLSQEEDWTVPGGYQDSMSSNTELGRAVQDACEELDNLSNLEKESLSEASKLLQKLGYKGDIFQRSSQTDSNEQPSQD